MQKTYYFIIFFIVLLSGCYQENNSSENLETTDLNTVLSTQQSDEGFAKALTPRMFEFPLDHGSHPQYRTEWWYFTGNLQTQSGRHFGFQFTLFRFAIRLSKDNNTNNLSAWHSNQLYMAHFAISDIKNNRFYHQEKLSRGILDLVGISHEKFHLWIEDWQIEQQKDNWHMQIQTADFGLNLKLFQDKPIVLQGEQGLSQKSDAAGNASYYYSIPRFKTQGKVHILDKAFDVSGLTWLDREWSTSALAKDQQGWDWFALQLNDNKEIMLYQMRLQNQSVDQNYTLLTYIDEMGEKQMLSYHDYSLKILDYWQADKQTRYPSKWQLQVPSYGLDVIITPLMLDQEWKTGISYWEGAVRITDAKHQSPLGFGYVELTGYRINQ